jgi:acyl-CoA oxidase
MQTELGHGTNISALETTATYIPGSHEFEIHLPTLMSSKWWNGALGKTSTHGILQAKLILLGSNDVGPHLFFIQLRDMGEIPLGVFFLFTPIRSDLDMHQVLPEITIGDIGIIHHF